MDELAAIAYHRERVAARRLAQRDGIGEAAALQQVLQASAAPAPLADLIATRRLAQLQAADLLARRRAGKAAQRAGKAALLLPDPAAWQAWFDGATHPNPGKMGLGGLLRSPAGVTQEICRPAGSGDSNEAECLALIAVLELAVQAQASRLVVFGDSRVVLDAVGGNGTAGGLEHHCAQARGLLAQLGDATLRWIPRHKNAAADALSQQAIRRHDGA